MTLSLELDDKTRQQLEQRVQRSEFESIEAYIEFIIQQVVAPAPEIDDMDAAAKRKDTVRDRLKSLGYIE